MNFSDLRCFVAQLPEDILKEKWSGNFDRARALIARRLESDIPEVLRTRLKQERYNLDALENNYTIPRREALQIMQEHIPGFTEEEFEELHLSGKVDWIYINGETRYLSNFYKCLMKVYPEYWVRAVENQGQEPKGTNPLVAAAIKDLKDGDLLKSHIQLRHEVELYPHMVREGENLRVYIPLPVERQQITNLKYVAFNPEPVSLPKADTPQPTAYFEAKAEKDQVFSVEYAFDYEAVYHDLAKADLDAVEMASVPEATHKYLEELWPHIKFTPYLRMLAEEIRGDETNLLVIARRIYDYITTKVEYRYVRDYKTFEIIPETVALQMRGDCGQQALLFITLCRICGIPVRWQSGLSVNPDDGGAHDWCQFYIPSIGWVYADLSLGGAAYRRGDYDLWNFHFGNLDPYRVPINNEFQVEFDPPKEFWRKDPYDNQMGELEYEDGGIYHVSERKVTLTTIELY
ncbi:MAG: transglutaminase domain-containing protein [Firmicutes bacterium]|nr:transglutaminase domain-containing protein [Bacillota bacterium]